MNKQQFIELLQASSAKEVFVENDVTGCWEEPTIKREPQVFDPNEVLVIKCDYSV